MQQAERQGRATLPAPLHARALRLVLLLGTTTLAASPGPQPAAPSSPIPPSRDEPYPGTLQLAVDATDVDRRIITVHEEVPVSGGKEIILMYPRWLPGTHAPEGTIQSLAGLVFTAGGVRLPWVRDTVDVFAFHVPVPAGVDRVAVDFTYLSPVSRVVGRTEVSHLQLAVDWNAVVLYPAGYFTRQIPVEASIRVPDGWTLATALEVAVTEKGRTRFKPVPVETLVDSPLRAARHARAYALGPKDSVPVTLNLMADRADLVDVKPELIELHRALVLQAYRLFGSHHYNHYNFLLQLSDDIGWDTTLEHHRSAEYGEPIADFTDWDKTAAFRDVIPHEYVHSWDGKFRRPADLWTPDFHTPMRDSLLWVYEGGTQYWGQVLTARAGLWTRQEALDELAMLVAALEQQPGRSWRNVQDTTNDEIINPRRPQSWPNWQRFEDYYPEGALIWLDADTLIREKTLGKHSLDDFARAFFGIEDGSFVPVTYNFEDVVHALNAVLPYDWAGFLRSRLDAHGPGAPVDGVRRGGYRLVFTEVPSEYWKSVEATRTKSVDERYSLGLMVDKDAEVSEVAWDSPAFKAGLTAGAKLIAVDGLAYEPERLRSAIARAKTSTEPLELLVRVDERFRTVRVDYHGGLRYPHLERDMSQKPLLDDILSPRK
jgi:predicted metalloprotease with PDZ domain